MRSRQNRRFVAGLAALLLTTGLHTGCADSREVQEAQARAEAERRFGRPADAADAGDPARSANAGTSESETTGAAPPPGDADSGDPPADPPALPSDEGAEPGRSSGDPAPPSAPQSAPIRTPPAGDPTGRGSEGTGRSSEAGPTDPDEILAAADRAYSGLASLRASFVQRVDVPLLDRTTQGHGTWYQVGRDRFRMDFDDPPDDVFVADGTDLWLYQPSANPNQVLRCSLADGRQTAGGLDVLGRILSEARASYEATWEGTAIVSGRSTHAIALRPIGPSEYRLVRVWVDEADSLVRRFRIEEDNETLRTVTLADLEPDVPLEDALFQFTPPPGVEPFDC